MYFVEPKHAQKENITRRTMSSVMNLLLIASFVTAPTSIVLLPTISFAVPLPVPTWMTRIVHNLRKGELTQSDLNTLEMKSKPSFNKLISIISRIDRLAVQQNSAFRLDVEGIGLPNDPSKVGTRVRVISQGTEMQIAEYNTGVHR